MAAAAVQARGFARSERGVTTLRRAPGLEGSRGDRDGGKERAATMAAEAAAMVVGWEQESLQEARALKRLRR